MTAVGSFHLPQPPDPAGAALTACVDVFQRWLHLPDPGSLYVTLAAVVANRTAGDPVWLLLVGPPGSGKTEVLGPVRRARRLPPGRHSHRSRTAIRHTEEGHGERIERRSAPRHRRLRDHRVEGLRVGARHAPRLP